MTKSKSMPAVPTPPPPHPFHTPISRSYTLFGMIIAMTAVASTLPYLLVNVDENAFCTQKAETWFSELAIIPSNEQSSLFNNNVPPRATYSSSNYSCEVPYTIVPTNATGERRDGLVVATASSHYAYFDVILTTQADRDYLASDDGAGGLLILGIIASLITAVMLVGLFAGVED